MALLCRRMLCSLRTILPSRSEAQYTVNFTMLGAVWPTCAKLLILLTRHSATVKLSAFLHSLARMARIIDADCILGRQCPLPW
jgi:hypothetical protein